MRMLLDDKRFFKDYFNFRDELERISELRIDSLGEINRTPIFEEDVPWSDKHDQYADVMYSKNKMDWPRLKLPHESLRRFAHVYFAPLGIRASVGDYVFFEWLMGFNPSADNIKREHFGHVSKVAWCCWKLIEIFKEVQPADDVSVHEVLISSTRRKFKAFLDHVGVPLNEDTDFGRILLESVLLAAYMHDKGIILNFYDDLREKVLHAFKPMWDQSLLYYGGTGERARKKYSSFCDCDNVYDGKNDCSVEDVMGMERVCNFFAAERVLGRDYWHDIFCNYATSKFPRTIYDEVKKNYHGVYAALELLAMQIGCLQKNADQFSDSLEREFILALAAEAVALHDLKVEKRIDLEESPTAFLLYLADEIQQWQRHQLDINKLLNEQVLYWGDGEIQKVCIETDENDLFIQITKISNETDISKIKNDILKAERKIQERLDTKGLFTIHYFIDTCNICDVVPARDLIKA
ncbi:MAG: hypothetical protein HZB44_08485 [Actinobacteria bacterium]|nr:hypothetical protein [Actinomycetota bacterium]